MRWVDRTLRAVVSPWFPYTKRILDDPLGQSREKRRDDSFQAALSPVLENLRRSFSPVTAPRSIVVCVLSSPTLE